ncbi:MAG: hypothetical protein ABI562_04625 [Chloroflexota bacterium]
MSDDPTASSEILRGASDGLLIAIREVDALERLKRGVPPADPRFAPLAREVRIAAEAVLELARREEATAERTSGSSDSASLPTINASPSPPDLAGILAAWRDVEHRLNDAEPGSPESEALMTQFEALRGRYSEAMAAHRAVDER